MRVGIVGALGFWAHWWPSALEEVEHAIVALAANLMTVARGAGRPFNALSQANELVLAA